MWWLLWTGAAAAPLEPAALPEPAVGLTLDRTRYLPGDAVWLRLWDVRAGGAAPWTYADLVLLDPAQRAAARATLSPGSGAATVRLPEDATPGTWTLRATMGPWLVERELEVVAALPAVPKPDSVGTPGSAELLLHVSSSPPAPRPGESVTLSVSARGRDGEPVDADLVVSVADSRAVDPAVRPLAADLVSAVPVPGSDSGWGTQTPPAVVLGKLPMDALQRATDGLRPKLDACRAHAPPAAAGVVRVKVSVAPSGAVQGSEVGLSTTGDPAFDACAAEAAKALVLPPAEGASVVSLPVWVVDRDRPVPPFVPEGATAWFEPSVRTGPDGTAELTFVLPQAQTTWVVDVSGAADRHVGQVRVALPSR